MLLKTVIWSLWHEWVSDACMSDGVGQGEETLRVQWEGIKEFWGHPIGGGG